MPNNEEVVVNTGVTLKPSPTITAKLRKKFGTHGQTIASAIPAPEESEEEEVPLSPSPETLTQGTPDGTT